MVADNCTDLQGFLICNACGGGTGSGLGCLMLERLPVDYFKKSKICFTVWSYPQVSTAVVGPYNTLLCLHSLLEHTNVTNQIDNEALDDILIHGTLMDGFMSRHFNPRMLLRIAINRGRVRHLPL